jgi:diaminopimelate decarboxylase
VNHFDYKDGMLHCEELALSEVAAAVGTPCYVYSERTVLRHYHRLDEAFGELPHLVCYAVKSNPNLGVLKVLANAGAGAEVVSGGELFRALKVGITPDKIVFNGNGKTEAELEYAVESGILMVNADSAGELRLLNEVAGRLGRRVPVALRVNPDIDPGTHPYIATGLKKSKFGVGIENAVECYGLARELPNLEVMGVHSHIGSQITNVDPFVESVEKLVDLVEELRAAGHRIEFLDFGGGIGITYDNESPPTYEEIIEAISPHVRRAGCTVLVEPGRSIVGNAGVLLTRVLYVKQGTEKDFVVVDTAMNDLARPSLYGSYHAIQPVTNHAENAETLVADVVGGICESGDFLAKDRRLATPRQGDLLAIMSAGAYGSAMSSMYNSRPLVPEVLVSGGSFTVVRRRPSYDEMVALESPD